MTAGSKYFIDHPPCLKPPSVSSLAPPGACTTPSRLMNSVISVFMDSRDVRGGSFSRQRLLDQHTRRYRAHHRLVALHVRGEFQAVDHLPGGMEARLLGTAIRIHEGPPQ